MNISKLFLIVLLWLPVSSVAQNRVGTLKAPSVPTPIEIRERTIHDLLYFPFSCISDPMTTRELAWQIVENTFGTCEAINGSPGLHAGGAYDFTYRGVAIGLCFYSWYGDRTWYNFFFSSKNEADQFYNNMVKDIQNVGIPLTNDNIYGGMSNRKKPVSVFKWVYVFPPVKVKKPGPSNIEPEEAVGKYKVELGVYKRKHK
ncbi:MAG: hypothetical protein K6E15_08445 [Prevotella sp.]|nr:hypothetical protein [Prevotella sp.]